jgi:general secretion pathway protein K
MILIYSQKGIALIVTLLALVLITALVVEFSYGVYIGTSNLYNWRDSQRLSLMAKSGVNVSAKFISSMLNDSNFKYTEPIELPVENPFEDFKGTVLVRIEDETSKFNINSTVRPNGSLNEDAYHSFIRLLKILSADEKIADRVADWIDRDSEARLPDSEVGARNAALVSIDELLLINGISKEDYDKLLPYITVFGNRDNFIININSAEKPVIMSLADGIDDRLAQQVIDHRKIKPLEGPGELDNIIGSAKIPSQSIVYTGDIFSIKSTAASGGVKRVIETVVFRISKSITTVQYWKEY